MKNITLINGGRGANTLIPDLIKKNIYKVSSIINAYDDGKSTGTIREFFSILGPSDIRKVQSLFLKKKSKNYINNFKLFDYRFKKNISNNSAIIEIKKIINNQKNIILDHKKFSLKINSSIKKYLLIFLKNLEIKELKYKKKFNFNDCSLMNCIYAGAIYNFKGNINKAIFSISKIFNLNGVVLINSPEIRYLTGIRSSGEILYSESEIVEIKSNKKIDIIFLLKSKLDKKKFKKNNQDKKIEYLKRNNKKVKITFQVKNALLNSDIIIYAPGTQHSSLFPTYMTKNFANIIKKNKNAIKIFVTNIGADFETPTYKASDYIKNAFKYLKSSSSNKIVYKDLFDYILINDNQKKHKNYVKYDKENFKDIDIKLIVDNFEDAKKIGRHNSNKIIKFINGVQKKVKK